MKSYKIPKMHSTGLSINTSKEGETIEMKIVRILETGQKAGDGAPLIYTDRKDGIVPAYDPRTDRWEIAVDGMDKVANSKAASREGTGKKGLETKVIELPNNGGTEPIQAT